MKGQTIGELAKNAGVNIETIRYYERLGLIPEPPRTQSGYRVFPLEVVHRIRFIKRSQDLGFTLSEINKLLSMTESGSYGCREVREFASQKIKEIELKIHDLQNMKSILQDLSSKCCDEWAIDDCPIIESLQD
ncbi:Hg(II)-responsive transcriptional regulator [Paradesulfitobacterium aromaticivorans]